MGEAQEYKLRCELRSHLEDVRCICITDNGIATGSRDKTIKLWHEEGPTSFSLASTFVGHSDYVSAITFSQHMNALISGSRDTNIIIWDMQSATPAHQLKGHQYQVAALAVTPTSSNIISASLDKTLRLWQNGACTATLEGHDAAVLSVVALDDDDTVISGSGDCSVKIWSLSSKKCISTIPQAHHDSVRALALLPGVGVVSGSHDATIKIWTYSGDCIAELVGHTALIYSVSTSFDGSIIASGSEDNTLRLWRPDGTCIQTIEHPGCVWSVAFLENGDVVSGCSDGVARVWSVDGQRCGSAELRASFDASITARKEEIAAASKENGDGGANGALPAGIALEDPSALNTPGTRDGQTKIVKEGAAGIAYSWDAAGGVWERIGEVVSGPDVQNRQRTFHQGREWDHVFDVDVADGAPPLKLAMDADENPYSVADRFIETYELPLGYREQIVAFILQNTGGGRGNNNNDPGQYVDPYTGASAYYPPPPGRGVGMGNGGNHTMATANVTGGGADPFTGTTATAKKHTPATAYLFFDSPPPVDGLKKKIYEFNDEWIASTQQSFVVQSDEDEALMQLLRAAASIKASASNEQARAALLTAEGLASPSLNLLSRLLSWPASQLFPCLDIARMLLLDANLASMLSSTSGTEFSQGATSPGSITHALAAAALMRDPPATASQQVALRCACNLFAQDAFFSWIHKNAAALVAMFSPCIAPSSSTKGIRLGFATLLLNIAVFATKMPGDELDIASAVIDGVRETLIATPIEDEEALYRALVAIGTLLPEHSRIRSAARDKGLLSVVAGLDERGDGRVKEVASEIVRLMRL